MIRRNPRVLLSGPQQPALLRCLDGWPSRREGRRAFLVQFAEEGDSLRRFATDSFDFAVLQRPSSEAIGQLLRVARQGLISLR